MMTDFGARFGLRTYDFPIWSHFPNNPMPVKRLRPGPLLVDLTIWSLPRPPPHGICKECTGRGEENPAARFLFEDFVVTDRDGVSGVFWHQVTKPDACLLTRVEARPRPRLWFGLMNHGAAQQTNKATAATAGSEDILRNACRSRVRDVIIC
mmetsp:Transcript_27187/g.66129  ORF Transcript_27187/g.66129 Transcript_27187/m.66129 type:complete len:152 (+) Transcript_27187:1796-2251(+)